MLNMNNEEALGIIFPNSYDSLIPELVSERLMASIPFAGRYRVCDFMLSSMVHSGIDNISLLVKHNYHSLMDQARNLTLREKTEDLTLFRHSHSARSRFIQVV